MRFRPEHDHVRSHRLPWRTEGLALLRKRFVAGGLILAALAIGGAITAARPDTDTRLASFYRHGALNQTIAGRTFSVRALGVRGAAKIKADRADHDTSGVWVIVKFTVTARREPTSLKYAALVDAKDRSYRATGRFNQFIVEGGYDLQPGVPVTAEVAFEVPKATATRLSMRLSDQFDRRLDAILQVRLPVSAAQVDRWAADPTVAQLSPTEVTA
jgi:hypothetical protein